MYYLSKIKIEMPKCYWAFYLILSFIQESISTLSSELNDAKDKQF